VVASDLPIGAGLSSSAALEVAAARVFSDVWHLPWEPVVAARVAQRAENAWVGVACGSWTRWRRRGGSPGTPSPRLPHARTARGADSGRNRRGDPRHHDARELVDSAYNDRRAQCAEAAAFLRARALRDVSPASFARQADAMPPSRAAAPATWTPRTSAPSPRADALRAGDLHEAGRLMNLSHASLRDDFEVSRRELDVMVDIAQEHPGLPRGADDRRGVRRVRGRARGRARAPEFVHEVMAGYGRVTGLDGRAYLSAAAEGASLESAPART
jgi:galactokinase